MPTLWPVLDQAVSSDEDSSDSHHSRKNKKGNKSKSAVSDGSSISSDESAVSRHCGKRSASAVGASLDSSDSYARGKTRG